MARNERGGLAPTRRNRERESTPLAGSAFRALLEAPSKGPFVMPASAVLVIYAARGYNSTTPLATLTDPDGNVREIASPGLNERGRTAISGMIAKGTRVEAGYGLEVQVSTGFCEWTTIARC